MPNFTVSYKFTAIDRFSAFAKTAKANADKLAGSMSNLARKVQMSSEKLKKIRAKCSKCGAKAWRWSSPRLFCY